MILILEWSGCITGVLGALLLALNNRWSGYGFVMFGLSNLLWMAYALSVGANGLLTMQIVYGVTSVIGIWQWVIRPLIKKKEGINDAENKA